MSVYKRITTTKSLTVPIHTTAERDALTANSGDIILNTDTGILNKYSNGWSAVGESINLLSFELDSTNSIEIGNSVTATIEFDNFIKENINTSWFTPSGNSVTYDANKAVVEFIPSVADPTFAPSINDGTVFTLLNNNATCTISPAQPTSNTVNVSQGLNIVSFITDSETISEGEPLTLTLTFTKSVISINTTDFSPAANSVSAGPDTSFTITYDPVHTIGVITTTIPIGKVFVPVSGSNFTTTALVSDDTTVVADLALTSFVMANTVVQQGETIDAVLTFNKDITGSIAIGNFDPNATSVVLSTNTATASLDTSIGPLSIGLGYTGSIDVGFDVSAADGTLAYPVGIQDTSNTYEVKDLTATLVWDLGIGSKNGTQDLVITFNHAVDAASLTSSDFDFGTGSFVSLNPTSGTVTTITLSVQLPGSLGAYTVDLTGTVGYEGTQKTFSTPQTSTSIVVTELSASFAFNNSAGEINSDETGVLTFNMPVLTASVELADFNQTAVDPIVPSVDDTVFTMDFTLPGTIGTHTVDVIGSFSPADGGTSGVLAITPSDSIIVEDGLVFAFNGKNVTNVSGTDPIMSVTTGSNVFEAVNTSGAATTGQLILDDQGVFKQITGDGTAGLSLKIGDPPSTDTEYGYTVYMYTVQVDTGNYISSFCTNVNGATGNSVTPSIEHRYNNKVHFHDSSDTAVTYNHTDNDVIAYRCARSADVALRGVHIWRNTALATNVKTSSSSILTSIPNGAIAIGGKVRYQTVGNVLNGGYSNTFNIRECYVYRKIHTDAEVEAKLDDIRNNWAGIIS